MLRLILFLNKLVIDQTNRIEDIFDNVINTETTINQTILTANNNDANEIINRILDRIDVGEMIFWSVDSIVNDVNYLMKFINQQQPSDMPLCIL